VLENGNLARNWPKTRPLLIIDVRKAIDDPTWSKEGPRNNLAAGRNVTQLLSGEGPLLALSGGFRDDRNPSARGSQADMPVGENFS